MVIVTGSDRSETDIRAIKRVLLVAVLLIGGSFFVALLIDLIMTGAIGIDIDETVFSNPFKFARLVATMATSGTALVIFAASIFRYKVKRKAAPLLLSCTFGFFTAGYTVYWFKMIVKFVMPGTAEELLIFRMLSSGIWLLLLPGALFLLFFIFEVFEDGVYSAKNHVPVRVLSAFLISCFALILISTYNDKLNALDTDVMDILLYVGFSVGVITFLYTFIVQTVSAFKIIGKTAEKVQRTGILFIGLSGVLFTVNIGLELVEQLTRALDIALGWLTDPLSVISQFLSLVASVAVYVGFIYPSLKGKQA